MVSFGCERFMSCNTEKASQLSLVRRPSFAVSKCMTGDLKLNPQRVFWVSTPSFQGGLSVLYFFMLFGRYKQSEVEDWAVPTANTTPLVPDSLLSLLAVQCLSMALSYYSLIHPIINKRPPILRRAQFLRSGFTNSNDLYPSATLNIHRRLPHLKNQ